MTRWEYKVESFYIFASEDHTHAALNALGKEGWEMVGFETVVRDGAAPKMVFKRPITFAPPTGAE